MISLEAYFNRIEVDLRHTESLPADLRLLRTIILAHTQTIAFENLNSLLRVPVPLGLAELEAKLVRSSRGGYCFEQNMYFAAVLQQVGFKVQRLAARVIWGGSIALSSQIPRAHMLLLVNVEGSQYLCDVGFGGLTPTGPLEFIVDTEIATPHETFRIIRHNGDYLLQARIGDKWLDVYLFDLQSQSDIDYEVANHFVATHPESHFRHTLMAARAFDEGRYALRNRHLTTFQRGGEKTEKTLRSPDELIETLSQKFGVEVPDAAAFEAALAHIKED